MEKGLGAASIRGRRLLVPLKGGDFSREVINRETAIIRGNTVYPSYIFSSRNASFPFETYLNILLDLFCPKTNNEKIQNFWPKSRANLLQKFKFSNYIKSPKSLWSRNAPSYLKHLCLLHPKNKQWKNSTFSTKIVDPSNTLDRTLRHRNAD